MVNKKTCLMVLAVLFFFIAPVVYALPQVPPLPAAYHGNITVNGELAPVGTIIIAKIEGCEKGRITTNSSGRYGEDFYERLIVEGGKNGDIVRFYVEGVKAKESVTWVSGCDPTPVDLTFIGVPTPTPTPPNGGDGGGAFIPTPPIPTSAPTATPTLTGTPTTAPTISPSTTPTQTSTSTPAPVPRIPTLFLILIVIAVIVIAGIIIIIVLRR